MKKEAKIFFFFHAVVVAVVIVWCAYLIYYMKNSITYRTHRVS